MHVFFGYPYNLTLGHREFVASVCAKRALPLRCADKHFSAESIWARVQSEIDSAAFAVFDLTDYNHNVLLELGYALGKQKDVILLLHVPNDKRASDAHNRPVAPPDGFPSNLAGARRIQYGDRRDLDRQLLEALDNVIRTKPKDDQFWIYLRNFLKDGSQDRQSISTFIKNKIEVADRKIGERLEAHFTNGQITKRVQGKVSIYDLSQSALH